MTQSEFINSVPLEEHLQSQTKRLTPSRGREHWPPDLTLLITAVQSSSIVLLISKVCKSEFESTSSFYPNLVVPAYEYSVVYILFIIV